MNYFITKLPVIGTEYPFRTNFSSVEYNMLTSNWNGTSCRAPTCQRMNEVQLFGEYYLSDTLEENSVDFSINDWIYANGSTNFQN